MKGNRMGRVAVSIAVIAVALAAAIPRQEIAHTEPDTLGSPSVVLYDYLVVTRVAILLVGLAVAGVVFAMSRRHRSP